MDDPPTDGGAEDEEDDIELCLTYALIFQYLSSFIHCYRKDVWSSQTYFDENQSKLFKIETVVKLHLNLLTHYQILTCCLFYSNVYFSVLP